MSATRSLDTIANEIFRTWKSVHYSAMPYLEAMTQLYTVDESYGQDSGKSIVLYFLSNASTWRGEDARRIKAELKKMVG
jgi:hypothetical protein